MVDHDGDGDVSIARTGDKGGFINDLDDEPGTLLPMIYSSMTCL